MPTSKALCPLTLLSAPITGFVNLVGKFIDKGLELMVGGGGLVLRNHRGCDYPIVLCEHS